MRLRLFITLCVLSEFCIAGSVFALDQESVNFQNKDSTFAPALFNATSPNFQLNGSIESMVGSVDSANFTIKSGVPLNEGTAVTPSSPPPSTGGGGGGGLSAGSGNGAGSLPPTTTSSVSAPTFQFQTPTFFSHQMIRGTRDSSTVVLFNGSENGVIYPDSTHWQFDLPLFLGFNDFRVNARTSTGQMSPTYGGTIERRLIGDVNVSHRVDDIDLSLFTRAWTKYTPAADFNEDDRIDDLDLSLLVSHWNVSF